VPVQHLDLAFQGVGFRAHVAGVAEPGGDPEGTALASAADDHGDVVQRPRVGRGLGQRDPLAVVRLGAGGPQRPHRLDPGLQRVEAP
jgi:hypothetical protein